MSEADRIWDELDSTYARWRLNEIPFSESASILSTDNSAIADPLPHLVRRVEAKTSGSRRYPFYAKHIHRKQSRHCDGARWYRPAILRRKR
jgi:hypothetical protein